MVGDELFAAMCSSTEPIAGVGTDTGGAHAHGAGLGDEALRVAAALTFGDSSTGGPGHVSASASAGAARNDRGERQSGDAPPPPQPLRITRSDLFVVSKLWNDDHAANPKP